MNHRKRTLRNKNAAQEAARHSSSVAGGKSFFWFLAALPGVRKVKAGNLSRSASGAQQISITHWRGSSFSIVLRNRDGWQRFILVLEPSAQIANILTELRRRFSEYECNVAGESPAPGP
ncbi:hypothetical protein HY504_01345 [Candidatus Wolfebacteria bacterium]|nr:hypothetical protein [Candidatus Wolfebacteria bacterium]